MNFHNSSSNELQDIVNFENLIWECTEESLNEAKQYINKFSKFWVQNFLLVVSSFKAFSFKILGDLFELTGPPLVKINRFNIFGHYLLARNIIDLSSFFLEMPLSNDILNIDEYEQPIIDNTPEYFIMRDDLQNFLIALQSKDIDIKSYLIKAFSYRFSLVDFAALFGSLDIIKYLVLNQCDINESTLNRSLQGGNEEVVEFILTKFDHSILKKKLSIPVRNHHNHIAKWIYESCVIYDNVLCECVYYYNTDMLLYFIQEQRKEVDEQDVYFYNMTPLMRAVLIDNIQLVKFLLDKGADITKKSIENKTAKDYIISQEVKQIFESL